MRSALALVLLVLAACDYDPRGRCTTSAECPLGQLCGGGVCAPPDPGPPNQAPVASPDVCTVAAGGIVECTVLANDVDPDGDALVAEVATRPGYGDLLSSEQGFVYVPYAGYTGADSFTYRASDGDLRSAPATVALTVTPPAP
jgi:hypothetical protein